MTRYIHCDVEHIRREFEAPASRRPSPDEIDAAHREALVLAEEAYVAGDENERHRAERVLYALHAYNRFAPPLHSSLSAVWAVLAGAKLRSVLDTQPDRPALTFDAMVATVHAALEEVDRRDHAVLDQLDADGLRLYAKNWYISTHGFEQQLISTLQRSEQGVRQMLYDNLGDELGSGGRPHSELRADTLAGFGVDYDPDWGGVLGHGGAFGDAEVLTEAFSVSNLRTVFSLLPDTAYGLGTFYSIEAFFPSVCRHVTAALRRIGATDDDLFFWALHGELDVEHAAEWLNGIKVAGLGDDAHARIAAGVVIHLQVRSTLFRALANRVDDA
jgi:hypothetical protein